jgi:hypothetical protein
MVLAGGGDAATYRCTEFLCGLDRAIDDIVVMGVGGGVGLIGILLTASGGENTPPELPTGTPGIVYLPR